MEIPSIYTLNNGLNVALIQNKSTDAVTIHLKGLVGSNSEKMPKEVGCAHLLEHVLISSNPKKDDIIKLGGVVYGVTSRDDVLFMVKVLKGDISEALEFLSLVLFNKNIIKKDVDTQKNIVLAEMERSKTKPNKMLSEEILKLFYPATRMAVPNAGTNQSYQKITNQLLSDFKERNYTPINFCLVLSGNFERQKAKNLVKNCFGSVIQGKRQFYPQLNPNNTIQCSCLVQRSAKLSTIRFDYPGFRVDDNRKYPLFVLSKIFSKALVETLQSQNISFYNPQCTSSNFGSYGLFCTYVECISKDTTKVVGLINSIFTNYFKYLTSTRVKFAKTSTISEIIFSLEKNSERAEYYSNLLLHGKRHQNHMFELEKIRKLSALKISRFAKSYFNSHYPKVALISDKNYENEINNILNGS